MVINKSFANFSEYLAFVKEFHSQVGSEWGEGCFKPSSRDWRGTQTWGECMRLAEGGWPEGLKAMEALKNAIFTRVAKQVAKPRIVHRLYGGSVNVGRYLSGRPDCFLGKQIEENGPKATKRILRMVINTGARSDISPAQMFLRGAIATTLAQALELGGYRVAMTMVSYAEGVGTGHNVNIKVELKGAGEAAQLDKLAFVFANASLHRRITFGARCRLANTTHVGGSVDVPHEERGDIYIPCGDSTASKAWQSLASAEAYILETLAHHGVALHRKDGSHV